MSMLNVLIVLIVFLLGALTFFLGFCCANNINMRDSGDTVNKLPKLNKNIKSNIRDKTDNEKEMEAREQTVFYN